MITKLHYPNILHFFFLLAFFATGVQAQTEGPDFPNTGDGPVYALSAGTNNFSGTVTTPDDPQDRFQIELAVGQNITGINTSITTNGSQAPSGFFSVNGSEVSFPGGNIPSLPGSPGTYNVIVAANFSEGETWTIMVEVAQSPNTDPTISGLPSDVSVEEDAPDDVFDISSATINDSDAGSGELTLKLNATGGIFDIAAGTGITITGHLSSHLTLTGNLTDLNNYIHIPSNIYFRPDQDLYGDNAAVVEVSINDNGNTGTGGGNDVFIGAVNVDITPVNDAPQVSLPATIEVTENTNSPLTGISFADVDAESGAFTVTFSVDAGTLTASPGGGVTTTGIGTGTLTLTGALAYLNTFLSGSNVTFLNESGNTSDQALTVSVDDNGNTGAGGNLSGNGTLSITVLPATAIIQPDADNILYVDINVNTEAAGYTGTGDSWANAVPQLQDALVWAADNWDAQVDGALQIWVADGTYYPDDGAGQTDNDRSATFQLVNSVEVHGGFAGMETALTQRDWAVNVTTLDGDIDQDGTIENNAYHIVTGSNTNTTAVLNGFTITGGNANGSSEKNGGGMYNSGGSSRLANLIFMNNRADQDGGGMFNSGGSPTLTNITFSGNNADDEFGGGGGIYNDSSSSVLTNVTFSSNLTAGRGGGMINSGSSLTLTNVTFTDNSAGIDGGGMYNSDSSPVLTNVTFTGNNATGSNGGGSGGGMYNRISHPVLINVTIAGNSSIDFGGGMANYLGSDPTLANVIIWGNQMDGSTNTASASIHNGDPGAIPDISYSLIANSGGSGGNWDAAIGTDGGNNIDLDPEFVSTTPGEAGYLQLSATSPAIDGGNNDAYTQVGDPANDLDLAGNPRVYDFANSGIIDIGAYEYQGETVPTIVNLSTPDTVYVDYGTSLDAIENLPTEVTATLSDSTEVTVTLDGNTGNWTLMEPDGGTYDGETAGTYVFEVPLILPEEGDNPYFTNPDGFQAEVTVIVEKGMPVFTVTWNATEIDPVQGLPLTYGDMGPMTFSSTNPDAEITYSLRENDPQVLDLTDLNNVKAQQPGGATLTVQQVETDNYKAASMSFAVTVAPKEVVVTADDQTKVYGKADPELTYTVTPALLDGDNFTGELEREEGETVGEYAITQGTLTAGDNYAITFETATLTITPANYEDITFNDAGFTYNGTEHTLTITGDLPEGASVTYLNNGRTDAGTQTVTARIDGGGNYENMELTAELTINPLSISVTADDKEKVYGAPDPELTYTADPLIGDDTFTGALEREPGENAGEYAITRGTLTVGDNYTIAFEAATLTITPANYENITFNDGEFTYDGTEHLLSITGELPEGTSVTYQNNGRTDAGTQTVTAQIDGGANYEDMELTAILTVHQASQEIVFDPIPLQHLESTSGFSLEAYATSGLPVTYSYTFEGTEPPATVTPEGEVTLLSSGEITITASQEGDSNFLPATPVSRSLQISSSDASIRILRIAEKTYENPGPETGYLIDCSNMTNSVEVEMETEANAVVTPGHQFTMNVPQPGIYTQEITVTSGDGSTTKTYLVKVEKQFSFEDIVIQKFDNVLLVNNNPETNGGYEFVAYKWYKNGVYIGNGQYYSAGDNSTDLLDPNATYQVEMTTKDGEVLRTCPMQPALQHSGEIIVYPNPVITGNTINILANIPEKDRENPEVKVYSLSGREIRDFHSRSENNTVQLSGIPPGVYILQYQTNRLQKTFKIIVK